MKRELELQTSTTEKEYQLRVLNEKYNSMNDDHQTLKVQFGRLTESLNTSEELVMSLREQLQAVQNEVRDILSMEIPK